MCPERYVSMFGKGHRDCPICEELFTRQDLVGLNEIRELCAQPNQKNALEELSSESLNEASMAAQTNMKVLYDAYHQVPPSPNQHQETHQIRALQVPSHLHRRRQQSLPHDPHPPHRVHPPIPLHFFANSSPPALGLAPHQARRRVLQESRAEDGDGPSREGRIGDRGLVSDGGV